jgi:hypothetical protein
VNFTFPTPGKAVERLGLQVIRVNIPLFPTISIRYRPCPSPFNGDVRVDIVCEGGRTEVSLAYVQPRVNVSHSGNASLCGTDDSQTLDAFVSHEVKTLTTHNTSAVSIYKPALYLNLREL